MKVMAIIPARGGSKGVENKNILPLCGRPVMGYVIQAAIESEVIDRVVVSTDSEEIAEVSEGYDVQVIDRPSEYAADESPIEDALRHAVAYVIKQEDYHPDVVVWLQANVPVRKRGKIDEVVQMLLASDADSAVSVSQVTQFPQWMKKMDKDGLLTPLCDDATAYRRQDIEPMYLLDGAIVAIRTEVLMGTDGTSGVHAYLGDKTVGVLQEPEYSIEIDVPDDFALAEYYLKRVGGA